MILRIDAASGHARSYLLLFPAILSRCLDLKYGVAIKKSACRVPKVDLEFSAVLAAEHRRRIYAREVPPACHEVPAQAGVLRQVPRHRGLRDPHAYWEHVLGWLPGTEIIPNQGLRALNFFFA